MVKVAGLLFHAHPAEDDDKESEDNSVIDPKLGTAAGRGAVARHLGRGQL